MHYYYLSNPYQGTQQQMHERASHCAQVCMTLISKNIPVFSPIVHNHSLFTHPLNQDKISSFTPEERFDFIMGFDLTMLNNSAGMIVLQLPGWEASRGVQTEIDFCKENNIPIFYHSLESIVELEAHQLAA